MMYIEGHWETVDTLEDAARIIDEYYNVELADRMRVLIDQLVDAFNNKIEELEDQIYQWECDEDDVDCWCDD